MTGGHYDVDVELRDPMKNVLYKEVGATLFDLLHTGCLRNFRKPILLLRVSVLGRMRDLQYVFAVIYGTLSTSNVIYDHHKKNLCTKFFLLA